jgi:hypothetical protein
MHITKHCLLVLCSSALLASGLTAQRAESTERASEATPSRTQREQATREEQKARESAGHQAEQTRESAAREAKQARENAAGAAHGAATAAEQRAMAAEVAQLETTHRARMAKLKRLKQLAEQSNEAARVKEIDKLQHMELAAHKRKVAMMSSRLDPHGRAAMERAMGHGRESKAQTPAERRKALEAWKKSHPGRSHGVVRHGNTTRESGGATRGQADTPKKSRDGNTRRDG